MLRIVGVAVLLNDILYLDTLYSRQRLALQQAVHYALLPVLIENFNIQLVKLVIVRDASGLLATEIGDLAVQPFALGQRRTQLFLRGMLFGLQMGLLALQIIDTTDQRGSVVFGALNRCLRRVLFTRELGKLGFQPVPLLRKRGFLLLQISILLLQLLQHMLLLIVATARGPSGRGLCCSATEQREAQQYIQRR